MSNFKVTRVNLYENGTMRAFATVEVAGVFVVTGIKVIEGSKGLFVSMPSEKNKAGEYKDTCFPNSKEVREELQAAVLKAYFDKQAE